MSEFLSENFQSLEVKFSIYLNKRVFAKTESAIFVSIVYNRAIVYKDKIFLKVDVHLIIIDQCNQTKVREKSRECHNHKPQPFPDTKRKRKHAR